MAVTSLMCATWPVMAQGEKATPYRPTVSNPAALPEPGWLELEAGVAGGHERDGTRRDSLPYLAKFAFTPDFGVLVGGEAFVSQAVPHNASVSGFGDTTVLLKHRFLLDAVPAAALGCEYGFKLPTGASGVGSGQSDLVLNGIYSHDFSGNAMDVNLNVTHLGDALPEESAYRYGWSATVFRPLDERWGVMAEVSGTASKGGLPQNELLLAASYEWSPRLVFDAGLGAGISSTGRRVAWFTGMSMLLGQVL